MAHKIEIVPHPLDFRVEVMQVMVERLTWRASPPIKLAVRS